MDHGSRMVDHTIIIQLPLLPATRIAMHTLIIGIFENLCCIDLST